ncbi:MAG: proton-conducting transporter membrane subunit [Cyanobacteriota bacterium]|nr:proton-conducting transporter membrane subunit [Cyanobacteriota bacterium]
MSTAWSLSPYALLIWLLGPYVAAFLVALFPALSTGLILLCGLATALLGSSTLLGGTRLEMRFPREYGVDLSLDPLSGWFLLLAGLVCLGVWMEARRQGWERGGWLLLLVLLGALNTSFLTTDLVSLYVSLEVVAISAFLLILWGATANAGWIALRYLLVSNTAMGLFMIGAALVYAQSGSFRFEALAALPPGAPLALVLVGLLTKSGVFLNGLWLPRTHAEAPAEVSALLSGVVVSAGALPLLRLEQLNDAITVLVVPIGLASAALGLLQALTVNDAKRLLAWSTLAQMGLVVLTPAAGGVMALSHGLAKAGLFLTARHWPGRSLRDWRKRPLAWSLLPPLWMGSLSVAALPPLLGFTAKKQLQASLTPELSMAVLLLSIGSVAVYVRLFLAPATRSPERPTCWGALLLTLPLLLAGLAVNAGRVSAADALLGLVVLALGLLLHLGLETLRNDGIPSLPQLDRLPDLLGGLGVVGAFLLVAMAKNVQPLLEAGGG